jgi:iron complex transport system substrate-binding protein
MSKTRRRMTFLPLALVLSVLLLVALAGLVGGCGSSVDVGGTSTSQAAPATTQGTAAAATTTTAAATNTTAAATPTTVPGDKVTFTDQAGRTVTIPKTIKKVYGTSPIATDLVYMLAPDMLAGWNFEPAAVEKKFTLEKYQSLPNLGGWYGKNNTGNIEEIIKAAPDIILSVGTIDDASKTQADRIQEQLKIPVVQVDGALTKSGDAFRYIGKLLGATDRAEQLAAYCDGVVAEAQANTAKLTDAGKVNVYYAEGTEGLNTDPSGSQHTEILDLVGAINVAQVKNASGYGMAAVSLEQVIAWDPALILVASDPSQQTQVFKAITTSADWASIAAVKTKAVYQIPHGPFDWFDRPPCPSRILGIRWVGSLLYPDLYKYDMKAEVKKFYTLFYQMDLSDSQLAELTLNAGVK